MASEPRVHGLPQGFCARHRSVWVTMDAASRLDYEVRAEDLDENRDVARVEAARERQRSRFEGTGLMSNADMGPAEVRTFCQVDDAGRTLLRAAMQQLQMSARAYHRILKLSRTIADLAGSEGIETAHLAEAIQYRPRRQM